MVNSIEKLPEENPFELQPSTLEFVARFDSELDQYFEVDDRTRIAEALDLMLEVHIDQEDRPDSVPYVEHPLNVAANVLALQEHKDADVIIAALLHDTVEDQADKLVKKLKYRNVLLSTQDQALLYIGGRFGARVEDIVDSLTNPDFEQILSDHKRKVSHENKNQLYAKHVAEAIKDPDVFLVKCMDFCQNALNLDRIVNPAKRLKLLRKYTPVINLFITRIELGDPYNVTAEARNVLLEELNSASISMHEQLAHVEN